MTRDLVAIYMVSVGSGVGVVQEYSQDFGGGSWAAQVRALDNDADGHPLVVELVGIYNPADYCWSDVTWEFSLPGIVVNNVAPTVDGLALNAPAIDEGQDVQLDFSVTDASPLDTLTVTVDWGDGSSETITHVGYLPIYTGQTFSLSHQYLDDDHVPDDDDPSDPTKDPSVGEFTVTVTVTDDDGGSGTDSETVTVNNLPPTVVLDPIPPIIEGDTFTIAGALADPGIKDTHTVTLKADLDFDGTFSAAETFTQSLPAGFAFEPFTFTGLGPVPDDGPSPGNGTAFDQMHIVVEATDDDSGYGGLGTTMKVRNVAPQFAGEVSVGVDYNAQGQVVSATLTGAFTDPGSKDVHRVSVQWGDGAAGTTVVASGDRTFTVTRVVAPGAVASGLNLFPIQLTLSDDDTGETQQTKNAANACLVKSLDVISEGFSQGLAVTNTQASGVVHAGGNLLAGYLAHGEGNINNCTFQRTVIDHVWFTENGQRKDFFNTNGQEIPDGPRTTPQTPNAGVDNSGINIQGNSWLYFDQDGPGFVVPINETPAGKKATYTFRIKNQQGLVVASATWTLDLKMDQNGAITLLPGVGAAPLNPPVKIG